LARTWPTSVQSGHGNGNALNAMNWGFDFTWNWSASEYAIWFGDPGAQETKSPKFA
jgi:hypothetical protein